MAILDTYTGAKSGLSLWRLVDTFTQEPILVERVSDQVQAWIPFDANGYASETALNLFLGPENDPASEQEAFIVDIRNQIDPANHWSFTAPVFYGARIRVGGVNVKGVNGKLGLLFDPTPYGDSLNPTSQMDIHTNGFTGVFQFELYDTNTGGASKYLYRNTKQSPDRGIFLGYRDGKVQLWHRNAAGAHVNEAHNTAPGQNLTIDIAVNEAQSNKLLRHNGSTFNSMQGWSLSYSPRERIGDTSASSAPWLIFQCAIIWNEFRSDSAAIGDAVKNYFDVTPPIAISVGNVTGSSPMVTVPSVQAFSPNYTLSVSDAIQDIEATTPVVNHTPPNYTVTTASIYLNSPLVTQPSMGFTDFMTIVPNIQDASCLSCNNGFIELSVTGFYPPFTCFWDGETIPNPINSHAIYNLVPGLYLVKIYDSNGGQKNLTFQIEVEEFQGFDFPQLFRHTEICEIYIASTRGLESTIINTSGKLTVTFSNGNWSSCYFIKGKGVYQQNEIPTDYGSKFVQQIEFEFAGYEDSYSFSIDQYFNLPVIILTRNQEGNYRVIGTKENPLFISHDFSSNSGNSVKLVAETVDESRELDV